MAEFNIKCPHCGEEPEAGDEWIGTEVECPDCEKTFVVPQKPKPILKKAGRPLPGKSEDRLFRAEVKQIQREVDKGNRFLGIFSFAILVGVILIALDIPFCWLFALGVVIFGLAYSAFA